jgi:DNA-binding Xre family transcriptional regulator
MVLRESSMSLLCPDTLTSESSDRETTETNSDTTSEPLPMATQGVDRSRRHPHHEDVRSLVAKNLTRLLEGQALTVAGLIRKSGISKTAILQIRRREKGARIDTLAQLADALGVEIGEFFLPEEAPNAIEHRTLLSTERY